MLNLPYLNLCMVAGYVKETVKVSYGQKVSYCPMSDHFMYLPSLMPAT